MNLTLQNNPIESHQSHFFYNNKMRISSRLPRNVPTDFLFLICGVAVVGYAAIGTRDLSATGLGLAYFAFVSCYSFCSSYFATIRWSRTRYFLGFAAIALGLTLFATFSSQPTHAQLFQQTATAICDALSSAGTGLSAGASDSGVAAAKTMIKSLMWVLRALIMFYILFAVFQIVQNRDDQQKMQEIAKTPIMIVFGTIIVDVLSSFVGASATVTGGC